MGQAPSKKMGRTRSKELSTAELSDAMASHTIRSSNDPIAGSPTAPIDMGGRSSRRTSKVPEKQGSVSSLSSATGGGVGSVRSGGGSGSLAPGSAGLGPPSPIKGGQGANRTPAAMGSSPPPASNMGGGRASPPPSPSTSTRNSLSVDGLAGAPGSLSPGSALTQSVSRSSFAGSGGQALDVDNMIGRLLEAGYSGKVTKSPPLKNAEILAVCMAAREVFLSQPTLIELSPPVKIVGDVHGQVSFVVHKIHLNLS